MSSTTDPNRTLPLEEVVWSVADGRTEATYHRQSNPPTRILRIGETDYFVLEIPFDARRLGLISLADPGASGRASFELTDTPTPLTCVPTVNGAVATVLRVADATPGGNEISIPGPDRASRGLVVRVDLAIAPPSDSYEEWAEAIWGSATHPDAQRDADPDRDGLHNQAEFEAGTDPRDPASVLRIMELTLLAETEEVHIAWKSVATRRYQIESAPEADGPWTALGQPAEGSEATTRVNLAQDLQAPRAYYRVRILP